MSKQLKDLHATAVAKFGPENISAMCNVCGATDGSLSDVPEGRRDELFGVLSRMTKNGVAVARAQADFATFKRANSELVGVGDHTPDFKTNAAGFAVPDDDAPARQSAPVATLDSAAIYAKWNRKTDRRLGEGK
jgi:hypothetical protein